MSCGKPIGHLWEEFKKRTENSSQDAKEVLDSLGLERYSDLLSIFFSYNKQMHRLLLIKTG